MAKRKSLAQKLLNTAISHTVTRPAKKAIRQATPKSVRKVKRKVTLLKWLLG